MPVKSDCKHSPFLSKPLYTAISLAILAPGGGALAQQDSAVEEVIVTGSFIRRSEGIAAASPVIQLSAEDLEAEGCVFR